MSGFNIRRKLSSLAQFQLPAQEEEDHFEFPTTNSRSKISERLENFLVHHKEVFKEYEEIQKISQDNDQSQIDKGELDKARDGANRSQNRYKDIVPYNWRSVRIPDETKRLGEDQDKYVNASWILFKEMKQKFIASQVSLRIVSI